MNLFRLGKKILQNHPAIIGYASKIYNCSAGLNRVSISGKRNVIQGKSFLHRSCIQVVGNDNSIDLGDACYLNHCRIYVEGSNNNIVLGRKCFLDEADFWIEDDNNAIVFGDKISIHGKTHLAATEGKKITVGKDCMFSSDVVIRTGDSHSIIDAQSCKRINHAKDVFIGDHVWLGNKTTVLKGATVGSNSIVASGAIVTGVYIQGNVILAGSPARIVKEGVTWLRERIE